MYIPLACVNPSPPVRTCSFPLKFTSGRLIIGRSLDQVTQVAPIAPEAELHPDPLLVRSIKINHGITINALHFRGAFLSDDACYDLI